MRGEFQSIPIALPDNPDGRQREPDITTLADGRSVAVWEDRDDDHIHARVFDEGGRPVSEDVTLDSPDAQGFNPAVTATPDGGFAVVWDERNRDLPFDRDHPVFAQRFDAEAEAVRDPVRLTGEDSEGFQPEITALNDGRLVASWREGRETRVQILGPEGEPEGDSFQLRAIGIRGRDPEFAALDDGGFVAAWQLWNPGESRDIFINTFDADGSRDIRRGQQVNQTSLDDQREPDVATLSDGTVAVAWMDQGETQPDTDGAAVRARVFTPDGEPLTDQFLVNTTREGIQGEPSVTALPDGGFAVVWRSREDGETLVRGQILDTTGARVGEEFVASFRGDTEAESPEVTSLPGGDLAVVFQDGGTVTANATSETVRGQILAAVGDVAPPRVKNDTVEVPTGETTTLNVLANDAAPDGGELTIREVRVDGGGSAEVADGEIRFTPDADFAGTTTLTYTAAAANGATATGVATVDVGAPVGLETDGTLFTAREDLRQPDVAALNDGRFVTVANDFFSLEGEIRDHNGDPVQDGFTVDPESTLVAESDVTPTQTGGFLVAIAGFRPNHITVQELNADGSEASDLIQVASGEDIRGVSEPEVVELNNGGFVVTWKHRTQDNDDVHARVFDPTGDPVGSNFQVNTGSNGTRLGEVTALDGGGFAVVWTGRSEPGETFGSAVRMRRFDNTGEPAGEEIVVNSFTERSQSDPDIQTLSNGNVVVTWEDSSQNGRDTDTPSIRGQVLDPTGSRIGDSFEANSTAVGKQKTPSIATLPDGRFAVIWETVDFRLHDERSVQAQLFDAEGNKIGDEVTVREAGPDFLRNPEIAATDDGELMTVFQQNGVTARVLDAVPADPRPPQIEDDRFESPAREASTLDVLANDEAPGTGELRLESVADSPAGTTEIVDGELRFTPDDGFTGITRVGYTAATEAGVTATGTATIDVQQLHPGLRTDGELFVLNDATVARQHSPDTAALDNGTFATIWLDRNTLRSQILDEDGNQLGETLTIDAGVQPRNPSLVSLEDGGFAAIWQQNRGQEIAAQRFDPDGTPVGEVMTLASGEEQRTTTQPDLSVLDGGDLLATWEREAETTDIVARRFDAGGDPLGEAFRVNDTEREKQKRPAATALDDGGFAVAWTDWAKIDDDVFSSIRMKVFDENGSTSGSEQIVNVTTEAGQRRPEIDTLSNGNILVTWQDKSDTGENQKNFDIKGRIFAPDGEPITGEIQANTTFEGQQKNASIAVLPEGNFAIAWDTRFPGEDRPGTQLVQAQLFDAGGNPIGDEIAVRPSVEARAGSPAIAANADGELLSVMTDRAETGADMDFSAVRARVLDAITKQAGDTAPEPPVAADDTVSVTPGRAESLDVLANDENVEEPGEAIVEVGDPEGASVEITGARLLLRPGEDLDAATRFTYTIENATGARDTATVTVEPDGSGAGPPEDAGPPDNAGPPEDAGPPDDAGPPEDAGPPDDAGPPEDAGPPDNAGPPEDSGPPEDAGPPQNITAAPDAPPIEPLGADPFADVAGGLAPFDTTAIDGVPDDPSDLPLTGIGNLPTDDLGFA